ncbi:hypothetical protein sscle_09g072080 [Sclerotinia sclerotiorum 1980 UF-70]|nr:hypothetical protein sscle_09g072080 [Sclerotinia sclerotiorum 1980 UF-70]
MSGSEAKTPQSASSLAKKQQRRLEDQQKEDEQLRQKVESLKREFQALVVKEKSLREENDELEVKLAESNREIGDYKKSYGWRKTVSEDGSSNDMVSSYI